MLLPWTLHCTVWFGHQDIWAWCQFYFDKLVGEKIGEAAFVFNAVIDADKIQVHLPTLEMMQMNQATLSSSRIKNGKFKIAIIVNSTDALDLNDEDGSAKDKYNVLFR